jgi:hypothetical protein
MLEGLSLLPNIKSLSLPNTIHCDQNENVASKLNKVFGPMDNLQKLSLSLCNLKGNVSKTKRFERNFEDYFY